MNTNYVNSHIFKLIISLDYDIICHMAFLLLNIWYDKQVLR